MNKTKNETKWTARQGDVFLERVSEIPSKVKAVARERGEIVLAHGEATGHAHFITDAHAQAWIDDAGVTFLEVKEAMALLLHQEHSTVEIPAGKYRVSRQVEYTPERIRNVAD